MERSSFETGRLFGMGGSGARGGDGNDESAGSAPPLASQFFARPATMPDDATTLPRRARVGAREGTLWLRDRSAAPSSGFVTGSVADWEPCSGELGCGCVLRAGALSADVPTAFGSGTGGRGANGGGRLIPRAEARRPTAGSEGRPRPAGRIDCGRVGGGGKSFVGASPGIAGSFRALRDGESLLGDETGGMAGMGGAKAGGGGSAGLALTVPDLPRERIEDGGEGAGDTDCGGGGGTGSRRDETCGEELDLIDDDRLSDAENSVSEESEGVLILDGRGSGASSSSSGIVGVLNCLKETGS